MLNILQEMRQIDNYFISKISVKLFVTTNFFMTLHFIDFLYVAFSAI